MALTDMLLQRDGWQGQAAQLSLTHGAVGAAAVVVAEQVGRRRSPLRLRNDPDTAGAEIERWPDTGNIDYANEFEAMRAKAIELQEQVARKAAAARIVDAHMKNVVAQAASAQERIAELEIELGSTQEALARQENENRSLQSSLDLMVGENARLSRRLLEECTACDTVSSRLERVNVTLDATDAEREKLLAAAAEADRRHQSETGELQARLKTTASRAAAAETQLAEVQQTLIVRTEEKTLAERQAVAATLARNLAENKVNSLQADLQAKEREMAELQQSRSKLMLGLNTLLQNFKAREAAFAAAKERLQFLGERLAATEVDLATSRAKIEQLTVLPESNFTGRLPAVDAGSKAQAIDPRPRATSADRVDSHGRSPQRVSVRPAAALLAETISF